MSQKGSGRGRGRGTEEEKGREGSGASSPDPCLLFCRSCGLMTQDLRSSLTSAGPQYGGSQVTAHQTTPCAGMWPCLWIS